MKSAFYLLVIAISALTIGWVFVNYLRPQIIERGCSEMAEKSSNVLFKDQEHLDPKYNYENVKARCLEDSLKTHKK